MELFQRSKDIIFLRNAARNLGLGIFRNDIKKAAVTSVFQAAPVIKKNVPKENKDRTMCMATRLIILIYFLARVLEVPVNNKAVVPFAIMVPVVDDLTDEEGEAISKGDIENCFISPNGRLFCNLLYKTTQNVKNIPKFEENILKVGALQSESKKQLDGGNGNLNKEILEYLTFKKGGYTGKLLLYLLKSDPSEEEEKAFYNMFSLMQLIDDFEDYKEDKEKGQHTLFTEGYYAADDVIDIIMDIEREWLKLYNMRVLSLTNAAKLYFYMASMDYNSIGKWLEHRPYAKKIMLG